MTEHSLDRFDVGAGADGETRCGVPQVVRRDAREFEAGFLGVLHGGDEPSIVGGRCGEMGIPVAEQELVGCLALSSLREMPRQQLRERHRSRRVRLGRPNQDPAANANRVLSHIQPMPNEVEISHSRATGLRPSEDRW